MYRDWKLQKYKRKSFRKYLIKKFNPLIILQEQNKFFENIVTEPYHLRVKPFYSNLIINYLQIMDNKGWVDFGVNVRLAWLTDEGLKQIKELCR